MNICNLQIIYIVYIYISSISILNNRSAKQMGLKTGESDVKFYSGTLSMILKCQCGKLESAVFSPQFSEITIVSNPKRSNLSIPAQ